MTLSFFRQKIVKTVFFSHALSYESRRERGCIVFDLITADTYSGWKVAAGARENMIYQDYGRF